MVMIKKQYHFSHDRFFFGLLKISFRLRGLFCIFSNKKAYKIRLQGLFLYKISGFDYLIRSRMGKWPGICVGTTVPWCLSRHLKSVQVYKIWVDSGQKIGGTGTANSTEGHKIPTFWDKNLACPGIVRVELSRYKIRWTAVLSELRNRTK